MTLKDLISRVRQNTRDTTGSLFSQEDVISFINEGIDRTRRIKKLSNMVYLSNLSDEPVYLPEQYHHLIALYATSRCFTQDENAYQAQTFMQEYEFKTQEMEIGINNGDIEIVPPDDSINDPDMDNVKDVYFSKGV